MATLMAGAVGARALSSHSSRPRSAWPMPRRSRSEGAPTVRASRRLGSSSSMAREGPRVARGKQSPVGGSRRAPPSPQSCEDRAPHRPRGRQRGVLSPDGRDDNHIVVGEQAIDRLRRHGSSDMQPPVRKALHVLSIRGEWGGSYGPSLDVSRFVVRALRESLCKDTGTLVRDPGSEPEDPEGPRLHLARVRVAGTPWGQRSHRPARWTAASSPRGTRGGRPPDVGTPRAPPLPGPAVDRSPQASLDVPRPIPKARVEVAAIDHLEPAGLVKGGP